MADSAGVPERATGKPYGRMFTLPQSLLTTLEATVSRFVDQHGLGKIPPWAYDDMSDVQVKVQITVYRAEGDK